MTNKETKETDGLTLNEKDLKKLIETLDFEFNPKDLKKRIQMLITAKEVWGKELNSLTHKPNFNLMDEAKRQELQNNISMVENFINEYFVQYTSVLTESLHDESKRLNKLTTVLIFLTAVLSVSAIVDFMLRIFHL